MKTLLVSAFLLLCCTAFGQGQVNKYPKPNEDRTNGKQITTVKKPIISPFYGERKFKVPNDNKPAFIKSVGDNSNLYGNLVFSEAMADESQYGIYSFTATPSTTVNTVKTDAGFKSKAAVYANEKYYTFYMEEAWGWVMYMACSIYNPETWEVEKIMEPSAEWKNFVNSSAVTYDEQTKKIYAVTSEDYGGPYILSTMNEEDGNFEKVADLERSYLTLAASPNGVLYGISDFGMLYKIDKTTGTSTLIGDTKQKPKYSQSMTFDPNTGLLYWGYMDDNRSALYQVNTTTATAYKVCDMPEHEEFIGLYVKKTDIADKAPMPVTGLSFTPNINGGTIGSIQCVAPTKAADGTDLTDPVTVKIYSGDETLAEQTVAPGATFKKDNVSFDANKLYSLFANAANAAGQSSKATTTVFIGKDVATSPSNVNLTINNKIATITWEAPTTGVNDGYINPDEVSYNITRLMGSSSTVVAENTKETTFSETLPNATGKYSYKITAYSNGTEGGSATSNSALSIGAYELPYSEDFSDGDACKQLFTFADVDNDGHDNKATWFWKEDEKLMQYCSDNVNKGNDWLFTPAIHFDGKHMYKLKFDINMGATSNLKVTIGKTANPDEQTEIIDLNGIYESWQTTHEATFTVPEDGSYNIGFYNYSDASSSYFNLFNINVEQGIESDVPEAVSEYTVTADPNGANAATLQFKTPEKLLNGKTINGNMNIHIYTVEKQESEDGDEENTKTKDTEIKTLAATAGQALTYKDDKAVNGNNTYKVVAEYNGKMGIDATQTIWAGFDIPEPVKNLKLRTIDGNMHVKLTWEAPEKGENDGYFNINDISYTVWRSLDKKNFSPIANNIKDLTYIDTSIEEEVQDMQEVYYYAVTADNQAGRSKGVTQFIGVGKPYTFPVAESFPNGRLELNPWSYKNVQGSLGWETLRSDDGGGSPQDNDNGFVKFKNQWGDYYVDSRLITPVISMDGTTNPTFSFYMFHWEENSIASDNKQTKLMIEVAPDGDDFDEPIATFTAANEKSGWIEHRVSLEKYKNCKYIQAALRGYTDNDWMYYYVDNIHFDEQKDNDLAVATFFGSENANINDDCTFSLTYSNRGNKSAKDYTIVLKQNDEVISTINGDEITPGETKMEELTANVNASTAGKAVEFKAEIVYDKDEDTGNNTSATIYTDVKASTYPCISDLNATKDGNNANLTWTAPVLPTIDEATVDGMEDYESFAISDFGDWITYDGDKLGSGKFSQLPYFDYENEDKAFQIWCPKDLGLDAESSPNLMPYSGNKCLIAWYANISMDGAQPYNDDYLISPAIKGGTEMSFYLKKIDKNISGETYEIMYSTTTQEPSAFKVLTTDEAPGEWQQIKVTMPTDARYFAIHYTGKLKDGIMVDDISYVPVLYALSIDGFNIFRNSKKINEEIVKSANFTDKDISEERHGYQVSVVYNLGESNASKIVYVDNTSDIENVAELKSNNYTIFSIDGKLIGSNLKKMPALHTGSYIINNKKVVIRK